MLSPPRVPAPQRAKGFSLVEAILAAFLLLTAVAMSAYVFDSSLQAEVSNEKRIIAALVADTALAEIRNTADNDYPSLRSRYDGQTWSLSEYPLYQISSRILDAELAVPCTELELQYDRTNVFPAPTGRYLRNSAVKAEVEVSWDDGERTRVVISEYITDFSSAENFRVNILLSNGNPVTGTTVVNVAKDGLESFSAEATSGASNAPVNDIQFSWYVKPITGFGSIRRVSRTGEICQYQNAYRSFDNTLKYSPGACFLVVKATFQGRVAKGEVLIQNG